MKDAIIITSPELQDMLKAWLSEHGYTARLMEFQTIPGGGVVVADVEKITDVVTRYVEKGRSFSVGSLAAEHEVPIPAIRAALETLGIDFPGDANAAIDAAEDALARAGGEAEGGRIDLTPDDVPVDSAMRVLDLIAEEPQTVRQLAAALLVGDHDIVGILEDLGDTQIAKVSAAREDGETVSCWMKIGTEAYDAFVEAEKARVDKQVEYFMDSVLKAAPKFYDRRVERMEILKGVIEAYSDVTEEDLRKDCRSMFYRMAELGLLEHKGHGWRAGKTYADRINVASLQGAVREVLMQSNEGLTRDAIAEKLPGAVADGLLRHAVKRMEDVYEQDGLLYLPDSDE